MKKRIYILVLVILMGNLLPVSAQEIDTYATNILVLNSSISQGDGFLQGAVSAAYTGSGCYAVYECTLQYLASTGVWTTASNTHVVRAYEPGRIKLISDNFYGLAVGTQYRYHVYAVVYNSDGVLVDADVANSSAIMYRG